MPRQYTNSWWLAKNAGSNRVPPKFKPPPAKSHFNGWFINKLTSPAYHAAAAMTPSLRPDRAMIYIANKKRKNAT
jgi:hypothetical protein